METDITTAGGEADQLRAAMRAWTSGVTIVTASYNGEQHGMTVNSFVSVSLAPPIVGISLQVSSRTYDVVRKAGAFGVTILETGQQPLAERFANQRASMQERLEGLETETLKTGAPFLKGGLVYLDCRVQQSIPAGMNTLFLAEVVAVRGGTRAAPLVYHDRAYHRLESARA